MSTRWLPGTILILSVAFGNVSTVAAGIVHTVNPGENIQTAIDGASPGDTVQVAAGSYSQALTPTGSAIQITKALTFRAVDANDRPTISPIGTANQVILILASDVTVDGFILTGGLSGVVAVVGAPATLTNLNLLNLDISGHDVGAGHAFNLVNVSNSVVSGNVVSSANNNGINIEPSAMTGSSDSMQIIDNQISGVQHGALIRDATNAVMRGNIVSNSTVSGILLDGSVGSLVQKNTVTNSPLNGIHALDSSDSIIVGNDVQVTGAHGIAIQASDRTHVVGNTISNSIGFTGILVHESKHCRIDRNDVSGTMIDGVTLSNDTMTMRIFETSPLNYVGQNVISSDGFAMGRPNGTGIWLNSDTYGNFVYGNSVNGFPEAGLSIWSSSSNTAVANVITDNEDGGIFLDDAANRAFGTDCAAMAPSCTGTNNVIHANHSFDNPTNGQVHLRGAIDTDVAYNFLSAAAYPNPLITPGSVKLGDEVQTFSDVDGAQVYANVMADFQIGEIVSSNVSNTTLYHNRHFNFVQTFDFSAVAWDAGTVIGGNHWDTHAAGGDPGSNPFCDIIFDLIGNTGSVCDASPFASETLGQAYDVVVYEPYADSRVAAGSTRSIRWKSEACVYVDLTYASSADSGTIATNVADIGYYQWAVPPLAVAGDYRVTVTCKDSAQMTVGASATGANFQIAPASIHLMTPGRGHFADTSSTLRVVWETAAGYVGPVDVFLDSGTGFALAGSTASAATRHLDIVLPAGSTDIARVAVIDQGNSNNQDSNDGTFSIRGTSGEVSALFDPEGQDLLTTSGGAPIGRTQIVEWKSVQSAEFVDLSYFDGTGFVPVASDIDDVGRYQWLTPDDATPSSSFRVVFKDESGSVLSMADSPVFSVPEPAAVVTQLAALISALSLTRGRRPSSFRG